MRPDTSGFDRHRWVAFVVLWIARIQLWKASLMPANRITGAFRRYMWPGELKVTMGLGGGIEAVDSVLLIWSR